MGEERLLWNKLKEYKCPKCKSDLGRKGDVHACSKCNFHIQDEKLQTIIHGMNAPKKRRCAAVFQEEANQNDLSNL